MTPSTALTSAASGCALAGADVGERILGGMAELLEARQIEEAAIALHGVDEAENLVEPLAVGRIRLPRDDRAGDRLQHVARFGDEIVDQLVHGAPDVDGVMAERLVNKPFTRVGRNSTRSSKSHLTD